MEKERKSKYVSHKMGDARREIAAPKFSAFYKFQEL
jgi:hypothetical protein